MNPLLMVFWIGLVATAPLVDQEKRTGRQVGFGGAGAQASSSARAFGSGGFGNAWAAASAGATRGFGGARAQAASSAGELGGARAQAAGSAGAFGRRRRRAEGAGRGLFTTVSVGGSNGGWAEGSSELINPQSTVLSSQASASWWTVGADGTIDTLVEAGAAAEARGGE